MRWKGSGGACEGRFCPAEDAGMLRKEPRWSLVKGSGVVQHQDSVKEREIPLSSAAVAKGDDKQGDV